jgi:hypothetical protein
VQQARKFEKFAPHPGAADGVCLTHELDALVTNVSTA